MEALSRRSLFAGACAVLAIGSAEVPAAANTAVKKIAGGRLSVNLKAVPALSKVGGAIRIGSLKGVPVAIARTGTSKYVAFNLQKERTVSQLTVTTRQCNYEFSASKMVWKAGQSHSKIVRRRCRKVLDPIARGGQED